MLKNGEPKKHVRGSKKIVEVKKTAGEVKKTVGPIFIHFLARKRSAEPPK